MADHLLISIPGIGLTKVQRNVKLRVGYIWSLEEKIISIVRPHN